jgi:hypothetical protein
LKIASLRDIDMLEIDLLEIAVLEIDLGDRRGRKLAQLRGYHRP